MDQRNTIFMSALLGACCLGRALAGESGFDLSGDRGFSYFIGLGRQTLRYAEEAETVRARSSASSSAALLMTGAVYAVHPDLLVALDNATTFAPGASTESWRATGATVPYAVSPTQIEDRAVNGPLLQTNRFSMSQSNTRLLAQGRVADDAFWVAGVALRSQSFKRHAFHVVQPAVVNVPANSVVEESASEVMAQAGFALESERVKGVPSHHGLRVSVGLPVWRRLDNTAAPDVSFKGTRGWDLGVEGRYSLAIHHTAHVGAWFQYLRAERARQVQGVYELPRATSTGLAYGLELLWKL